MVANRAITKFTVEEGGGQPEALVLVSADSSIDTSKVSLKLTKLNGIKKIYEITGQYDICVIVQAPTISEINTCIDNLRKISGVTDTNTVIILKTLIILNSLATKTLSTLLIGTREIVTIKKSKTFQPSEKNFLSDRSETIRMIISITKNNVMLKLNKSI